MYVIKNNATRILSTFQSIFKVTYNIYFSTLTTILIANFLSIIKCIVYLVTCVEHMISLHRIKAIIYIYQLSRLKTNAHIVYNKTYVYLFLFNLTFILW